MSESFGTRRSRASGIFRPKQSLGRRTKIAPTGRTTNTWDFENKLILAVSPLLNRVTCVYNPDGTRVRKES